MKVRAVIADDERLARERVRRLLAAHPWLECAAEARSGPETVSVVERHRPDVLFLDVEMPGLTGTAALARLEHRPFVIFTTAYRDQAVTAFDLRALDFLLKPIERERFDESLERLRDALQSTAPIAGMGDGGTGDGDAGPSRPPARIFVKRLGTLVPVAVDDIVRLEADGEYVVVHTEAFSHSVRAPLRSFVKRFDPQRFLRIHRSHVVNVDHVRAFRPHDGVRLRAELRNGTVIVASRRASSALRGRGV